jgi:hypothetical protein
VATKTKPVNDEFIISTPLVPDKTWSYKWNDERVTYEQYKQKEEEHREWVKSLNKPVEEEPKRKRKR